MFNLGPMEMIIVMGIAVLLFGKRLPEVGRSLGKGIVEFKKGLNGVADDFDISGTGHSSSSYRLILAFGGAVGCRSRLTPTRPCPSSSYPAAESSTTSPAPPTMEYQPRRSHTIDTRNAEQDRITNRDRHLRTAPPLGVPAESPGGPERPPGGAGRLRSRSRAEGPAAAAGRSRRARHTDHSPPRPCDVRRGRSARRRSRSASRSTSGPRR